jgi:hypothetical protein
VRFEVVAAIGVGILLPVLETCRRGIEHWGVNFTTMFEDHVAGALLLVGGWAAWRAKPWGRLFVVLAWAYVTATMGPSFWGQLEETLRGTSTEPYNLVVLTVKGFLWGICVLSLVMSFQTAVRPGGPS